MICGHLTCKSKSKTRSVCKVFEGVIEQVVCGFDGREILRERVLETCDCDCDCDCVSCVVCRVCVP